MRPVPVLMYHHVNPHRGDTVTVTPEVFDGQMRYLAEQGYRTLSLDELGAYLRGELALRERAVVVTFDDGWLDNYRYAFATLARYRIKATIFVVTGRTGQCGCQEGAAAAEIPSHGAAKRLIADGAAGKVVLGWELIEEMARSGLIEFHSHTVSHRKCGELAGEELRTEIEESKRVMEERLGRPCRFLCWPYGSFNAEGVALARQAGYEGVFTVRPDVVRPGTDPYAIPRIVVKDSVSWFKSRLQIYTSPLWAPLYLATRKKA